MSEPIQVSLISACRNEAASIRAFIDSLLAQEFGTLGWELLIADGESSDGTREILSEYAARHANVRIMENPGLIVSKGLNAAVRAARGEIIVRVDAHTCYAPDYALRSIEALQRTGADNVGGPARTRVSGRRARAIAAAYHSRFSTGGTHFHNPDYAGWVDTVPYGCWHRDVFTRIGGFDEELVRNQDDEFNLRLQRAGGRIWQDPSIRSWYTPRATFGGLFQQYFQYGYWKVAVIRKHRLPASWRHLVPVAFVSSHALALAALLAAAALQQSAVLTALALAWSAYAGCYVAGLLVASLSAARRHGFDLALELPLAFATFHFSYGFGFLAGLWRTPRRPRAVQPNSVFARITR